MADAADRPAPLSPGDFIFEDSVQEVMRIESCSDCGALIKVRLEDNAPLEMLVCVDCARNKKKKGKK